MRFRGCVEVVLALSAMCTACSSSGSKATSAGLCMPASGCGGDVSGTWDVESECFSIPSPFAEPECQGGTPRSTVDINGSVTYVPSENDPTSGTETVHIAYSFSIDEVYEAACLQALRLGSASAAACNGLEAYWAGPYAVTCAPVLGTCECQFADRATVDMSDGYTVNGQELVLDSSGPSTFCRSGDTLVESPAMGSTFSRLTLRLASH